MRRAIISDIHANLEALEAVLEDIELQVVDEIICLGDIVGYGANPNECTELLREKCAVTLLGNHDAAAVKLLDSRLFNGHAKIAIEWTMRTLGRRSKTFYLSRPLTGLRSGMTFVHATPYEPGMWYYITSLEEAAFNFNHFTTDACFIGHSHIPSIVVLTAKHEIYVHQAGRINLKEMPDARYLINAGSVGQPRDRLPKSCYAIIDDETGDVTFRRVAYNIPKAQAKMRKAGMPEFLIARLKEGR